MWHTVALARLLATSSADPAADVGAFDVGERDVSEVGFDVQSDDRPVARSRAGLELDLSLHPFVGVLGDGFAPEYGVDVGARLDRCGDAIEPPLGVDLALEVA